ncbi:MAG TPA: DNA-processing protein DprA [Streptosporangiaceae bacterium]
MTRGPAPAEPEPVRPEPVRPEPVRLERLARAALSWLAEPGDVQLGALLRTCSPGAIVAALTAGSWPPGEAGGPAIPGLNRALQRWSARLGEMPTQLTMDAWERAGIRLLCPGDPGWPSQLAVLGDGCPWALWVRGSADLRFACLRSVSIVGTRAATGYGIHVCAELAAALAERGWAVVSGGAFGIDGWAHRGALSAEGVTVAVLASGLDDPYPRGHHELFQAIAARGALVSERPPGRTPTRPWFLVRNRLIAALSRGTVVVEAALRSGALNTARHARELHRPLMAVPGPVTSTASAGCHLAIREWGAECVTGAADVLGQLSFGVEEVASWRSGPVLPRDELDPVSRSVLEAVPARTGWGPARIAVSAGVDFDTVMRCLGQLAAGGYVERSARGWRIRPLG